MHYANWSSRGDKRGKMEICMTRLATKEIKK
jgi:hypothetical protein